MSEIIYDTNIDNEVTAKITSAIDALEDARGIFGSIDSKLSNRQGWYGLAYGKCLEAHKAVKEYMNTISPICDSLKKLLTDLGDEASNFS